MTKKILLAALGVWSLCGLSPWAYAGEGPQAFHYQGVLTDLDDQPVLETVDLNFAIYDSSGSCLLYHETHTGVDLALSQGQFTADVGSAIGSSKRTSGLDPGHSVQLIFANRGQSLSATTNCPGGFSPTAQESRKIQLTVVRSGSAEALPMQDILAVPYAMVAESLQGFASSDFIQNSAAVSQTSLNELASGTSALYLKPGDSGNSVNFGSGLGFTTGQMSIGTSTLPATGISLQATNAIKFGQLDPSGVTALVSSLTACGVSCTGATWANSSNNTLSYWNGTAAVQIATTNLLGASVNVASPTVGEILKYSGSTWVNSPPGGDVSYLAASGAGNFKLARFSSTSGLQIKASSVTIDDAGSMSGVGIFTSSGDMTVDSTTFKVDSTNNRVGIGTAAPSGTLHVEATPNPSGPGSDITLKAQSSTFGTSAGGNVVLAGGAPAGTGVPGGIKLGGSASSPFQMVISATVNQNTPTPGFAIAPTSLAAGAGAQGTVTLAALAAQNSNFPLLGPGDTVMCSPDGSSGGMTGTLTWSCFVKSSNLIINLSCATGSTCLYPTSWRVTAIKW